ncbi:hypothetical protein BD311DRAFT_339484 [Dichomitus squalens]|uniref:Uncharacterized protein n=1 Tax=Dichomitus squalens TaxID=114155 RepID=A0A4Q9N4M9_9APHY|nr:hypothetical protein BD311DRAFT_339484 [Dichomitus squalens]
MDIQRARSPPASVTRRPIGPRAPGRAGTLPVKNIVPLDLAARLQQADEFGAFPRASSPESLRGSPRPETPASAPVPLQRNASASSTSSSTPQQVQQPNLRRTDSSRSEVSTASKEDHGASTETSSGRPAAVEETGQWNIPAPADLDVAKVDPTPPSPTIPDSAILPPEGPTPTAPRVFSPPIPVERPSVISKPPAPVLAHTATPPPPSSSELAPSDSTVPASVPPPPPLSEGVPGDSLLKTVPPPPPIVSVPSGGESGPTTPWTDVSRPQSTQSSQVHDIVGMYALDSPIQAKAVDGGNGHGHRRTLSDKSVQTSILASERPGTPASTSRASTPAMLKVVPKRPPLAPPPGVTFEYEPIKWKPLTLEAAQWTFTSEELQETVSRVIRQSAAEPFIRVVPIQTMDVELPQELERLEQLRATTQAQYRFNMHRRVMLLQSLAALSQQPDTDGEPLYNLTTQLAELTTSCDRLMETLMRVADHKAQIAHLQDLHIASALAMALRKLNASYAKRSAELTETRARNDELQAELEEAWNLAQDMAQEMDDLDNFNLDFSDDDWTPDREFSEAAEGHGDVRRSSHQSHHAADDEELSYSALEAEIHSDMDRMSGVSSFRNAEVIEITGKAVATKAVVVANGARGTPEPHKPGDRTSRVSAAKKRSSRTSKASLRIPKTPTDRNGERRERPDRSSIYSLRRRASRSRSLRRTGGHDAPGEDSKDVPQVPIIRLPEPKSREGSFLELEGTRSASPVASISGPPPPLPPKDGLGLNPGLGMSIAASRSEEVLPSQYGSESPQPSANDEGLPSINIPDEDEPGPLPSQQHGPPSSWRTRNFFRRRTQSMQPSQRPADDDTAAMDGGSQSPLKRSASETKHFDGWPFLGASKSQRFSVPTPVLSVMQKNRKSSDSAPAGQQ